MYQDIFLHSFLVKIGNSWPAEVAQWLEQSMTDPKIEGPVHPLGTMRK
jgi:hypothetical protein